MTALNGYPIKRLRVHRVLLTTSTASFAKFSLIGRYLSKGLGTTHVPVQEFALQVSADTCTSTFVTANIFPWYLLIRWNFANEAVLVRFFFC